LQINWINGSDYVPKMPEKARAWPQFARVTFIKKTALLKVINKITWEKRA
jgi:hypothetical protein